MSDPVLECPLHPHHLLHAGCDEHVLDPWVFVDQDEWVLAVLPGKDRGRRDHAEGRTLEGGHAGEVDDDLCPVCRYQREEKVTQLERGGVVERPVRRHDEPIWENLGCLHPRRWNWLEHTD